jgi:stage V sporulation protein AD
MIKLMADKGYDISSVYNDCGCMIFYKDQTAPMGASGCGCVATVLNGAVRKDMENNKIKNVLVAATGAMLSPVSSFQGESIPGISYALNLRRI